MRADRTLLTLRRRLERQELKHLRAHCAELADRLEKAERERDIAVDAENSAWTISMVHQDMYEELRQRIQEGGADPQIGMTQDGCIGLIKDPGDAG